MNSLRSSPPPDGVVEFDSAKELELLDTLDKPLQEQRQLIDSVLSQRNTIHMAKMRNIDVKSQYGSVINSMGQVRHIEANEMDMTRAVLVDCVAAQQAALDQMVRVINALDSCELPSDVSRNRRRLLWGFVWEVMFMILNEVYDVVFMALRLPSYPLLFRVSLAVIVISLLHRAYLAWCARVRVSVMTTGRWSPRNMFLYAMGCCAMLFDASLGLWIMRKTEAGGRKDKYRWTLGEGGTLLDVRGLATDGTGWRRCTNEHDYVPDTRQAHEFTKSLRTLRDVSIPAFLRDLVQLVLMVVYTRRHYFAGDGRAMSDDCPFCLFGLDSVLLVSLVTSSWGLLRAMSESVALSRNRKRLRDMRDYRDQSFTRDTDSAFVVDWARQRGRMNARRVSLYECHSVSHSAVVTLAGCCLAIRSLDLGGQMAKEIRDDTVEMVVKACRMLTELHLAGCSRITDKAVIAIQEYCPHLNAIDLMGCQKVTDEGVQRLVDCPDLRNISLARCSGITIKAVADLRNMRRLKVLSLGECAHMPNLGTAIERLARNCQNLRCLGLTECVSMTDTALATLGNYCPSLAQIQLNGCVNITTDGVRELTKCRRLTIVDLRGCTGAVTSESVEALATLGLLERADLGGTNITDDDVQTLVRGCTSLGQLNLFNCPHITDTTVEHLLAHMLGKKAMLNKLKNWERLDFYGERKVVFDLQSCRISDSAIHSLQDRLDPSKYPEYVVRPEQHAAAARAQPAAAQRARVFAYAMSTFKGDLQYKSSGSALFGRWRPRSFELDESAAVLRWDKGAQRVISAKTMPSEGKQAHRFDVELEHRSDVANGNIARAERRTLCLSADSEARQQLWLEKLGGAIRAAAAAAATASPAATPVAATATTAAAPSSTDALGNTGADATAAADAEADARTVTYAQQRTLPRLPIPDLDDTVRKFLATVKLLSSQKDYAETQAAAEAFLRASDGSEGEGPALQRALVAYDRGEDADADADADSLSGWYGGKRVRPSSYIEKFWTASYL
eukprot:g4346.t1